MIHPSAIVHPQAELAANVEVGPFTVIGADVHVAAGCRIGSHVVLEGRLTLGSNCRVFPHAVLGTDPQDTKYRGEPSELKIGSGCVFREFVTANRGSEAGGGLTEIGENCYFMANAHVAHDCHLGRGVVMANSVALAGHVDVGDYAWFGGLAGVHQFVHIGSHAFIAAGAMVRRDVPPCLIAKGDRARLAGLNRIGLMRRGFSEARLNRLSELYARLASEQSLNLAPEWLIKLSEVSEDFEPDARLIGDFLNNSQVGVSAFIERPSELET